MIYIDPKLSILAVCLLLTLPLDWLLSSVFAAFFHEVCHLIMLNTQGIPVYKIKIGIFGAEIEADSGSAVQEFLSAAAGPLGSLLLCLFYRCVPKIAICAAAQAFFNLIPAYPMDGGRMLRIILKKISPRHARKAERWVEIGVIVIAAAASLYFSWAYDLGIFPIWLSLTVIIKGLSRKRPCKQGQNRVQ